MKRIRILILLIPLLITAGSRLAAQNINIHSNNTWLTDTLLTDTTGWILPTYNDATWGTSVIATDTHCTYPHLAVDTLGALMWSGPIARTNRPNFFRKHFTVPCLSTVTNASISFTADDEGQVYLNGHALGAMVEAVRDGIATYSYATIQPYLICGDNVIAIWTEDTFGICWWAYFNMNMTLQTIVFPTDTTISACDSVFIGDPSAPIDSGYSYRWTSLTSHTPNPSPDNVPYVLVNPQTTTIYRLVVQTPCCTDTLYDTVHVTPCCAKPTAVLSIDSSTANNDTICSGTLVILRASGATWRRYYIDNGTDSSRIEPMPSGSRVDTLPVPDATVGTHVLCLVVYTASPDSTTDWCSDTTCLTFTIKSCCTRPTARLSINGSMANNDTTCFGLPVVLGGYGGTWGRYYIDNGADTSPILPVPISGMRTDTLPAYIATLGTHTLCFVAFSANPDSTNNWCSDTSCLTFTIKSCCTKPTAVLSIDSSTANNDTICSGSLVILRASGAIWRRYYIDNGADSSRIEPMPSGSRVDTLPVSDATVGTHTLCLVVYTASPDSTADWCSDTTCLTFTIKDCCVKPAAQLSINGSFASTDTVCYGTRMIIFINGGQWGKLYVDSIRPGDTYFPVALGGISDTVHVDGPHAIGTHHICFIAATDTTGACSDTICVTVVVQECGCQSIAGTSHLISVNDGDMRYSFYDSLTSVIAPNFINWIVDGSVVEQLVGTDTFVHQFGPGSHTVCMQTATVLPGGPNGDNICCYNTVCDTINIDACAMWKATDSITYQLDSTNVDSVIFTFHGSTSPLWPTLIWDFGDGTTLVSSDLTVGHLYHSPIDSGNNHNVCVNVIWSRGDSVRYDSLSVCCCADTICLSVTTTPCHLPSFNIAMIDSPSGSYVFEVTHSTGYTTIINTNWSVNGNPEPSGPFLNYSPAVSGNDTICANIQYTVLYNGIEIPCAENLCQDFYLQARGMKGSFNLYPNPTSGQMVVRITNYSEARSARIDIIDATGQSVMSRTINGLSKGIVQNYMDIGNLPQGVYTVKMSLGDLQQINKLIKE